MSQKIKYKNAPAEIKESISEAEIIEDFLPSPDKLIFKEKSTKITLNLTKESIDFFKKKAKEIGVPYQKMIKKVIDLYVRHYKNSGL